MPELKIRLIEEANGVGLYHDEDKGWIALELDRAKGEMKRFLDARERKRTGCSQIVAPLTSAGVSYVARGHWVKEKTARRDFRWMSGQGVRR